MSAYVLAKSPGMTVSIEYQEGPQGFGTYQEFADKVTMTEGGALGLWHDDGTLISAVSPSGWTRVSVEP